MDYFQRRQAVQPFPAAPDSAATRPDDAPTDDTTPAATDRDETQDAGADDAAGIAAGRDVSADDATLTHDAPRQPDDNPPLDRTRYTLTVEDVAVRLADETIYRDPRTIQRWCQSGKLDCLLDEETGEKYLIEPTSLERIVETLVAERERQTRAASRRHPDMSRNVPRQEATAPGDAATAGATVSEDDATQDAADRDMSRPLQGASRDDVAASHSASADSAALQSRITELESELTLAKADKQVREQMVDYLKEQFAEMVDGALDRAEQIGELRAENTQLKTLIEGSAEVDNPGGNQRTRHVE